MANVLSISTYPVSVPRHGGQIRVDAIHQTYRAAGHTVRHLAVYQDNLYPDEPESPWNVHFSWPFINELLAANGHSDVNAPDFLLKDTNACGRVLDLMHDFEPDIIQLEHCWMWPTIKILRAGSDRLRRAQIVYSSQNVEHILMKAAVAEGASGCSDTTTALVQQMEMDLVANAAFVIAVSKADAAVFQPTARRVVLAPNGIWPRAPGTGRDYWSKKLHGRRLALFVGSAHPPNASGFVNLLGPSLGFLSPTETVIVVGGVCNLLPVNRLFRENLGLNLARAMLVGVQDPGGLSTLLEMADVILVPITEGGGTNIKMAEALYNRKPVICTSKAVRGYDDFLDMPYILLCETADEFKSTLTNALRSNLKKAPSINRSQAERLESLLWSSTLLQLSKAIGSLVVNTSVVRSNLGERT